MTPDQAKTALRLFFFVCIIWPITFLVWCIRNINDIMLTAFLLYVVMWVIMIGDLSR